MKTYHIMNKVTKKRYIVPEGQFKILTLPPYFKAAWLKEELTHKRLFYGPLPGAEFVVEPTATLDFLELGQVTYKSVLDKEWILMPDTPAAAVLFS